MGVALLEGDYSSEKCKNWIKGKIYELKESNQIGSKSNSNDNMK